MKNLLFQRMRGDYHNRDILSMFIMVNDEVTVEELLKGIIIVSGNDACGH